MTTFLANYRLLVARVDELCRRTEAAWGEQIACRPGCDSCCRHLRLFPVEAAALAAALQVLPAARRAQLQAAADRCGESDPCPLLSDGLCQLYAARPLICRTHGFPLLLAGDAGQQIDFCPQNFVGIDELPAAAVIDLEKLNATLAMINRLYVQEQGGGDAAQLQLIGEVLRSLAPEPGVVGGG